MKTKVIFAFAAIFVSLNLKAQQSALLDSANFYGSMRTLLSFYNQKVEMENNSLRIGFLLQRKHIAGFTASAKLELGINVLKNNNSFKEDAASAENPSAYLVETAKPVTTRLGYLELSSDK